jgi:hypothetical protein
MPKNVLPSSAELEELDRFYREGGLRQMASPHVHYHDPNCPHPGCQQKMEWIDFQLELYGDPPSVSPPRLGGRYRGGPLVRAWWEGTGFVGRCPACNGWIHFSTLGMEAIPEDQAKRYPQLPDHWHTVAQFA